MMHLTLRNLCKTVLSPTHGIFNLAQNTWFCKPFFTENKKFFGNHKRTLSCWYNLSFNK